MDRRAFLSALTGGLLAAPLTAEAQPARTVYRIGVLEMGVKLRQPRRVSSGSGGIRLCRQGTLRNRVPLG
jgi:hypothetical protein